MKTFLSDETLKVTFLRPHLYTLHRDCQPNLRITPKDLKVKCNQIRKTFNYIIDFYTS